MLAVNLFLVVITDQFGETKAKDRERQERIAQAQAAKMKDPLAAAEAAAAAEAMAQKQRERRACLQKWLCPCTQSAADPPCSVVEPAVESKKDIFKAVVPLPVTPKQSTIGTGWGLRATPGFTPAMGSTASLGTGSGTAIESSVPGSVGGSVAGVNRPTDDLSDDDDDDDADLFNEEGEQEEEPEEAEMNLTLEYEEGMSCFEKSRVMIARLVVMPAFNNLIMVLIVLNTIGMASEHYQQPDWLTEVQVGAQ